MMMEVVTMARTIIDLDREAAEAAKHILGESTLTGVVNAALHKVIAESARQAFITDLADLDAESRAAMANARENW
jgi:hypothetical protein